MGFLDADQGPELHVMCYHSVIICLECSDSQLSFVTCRSESESTPGNYEGCIWLCNASGLGPSKAEQKDL